MNSSKKLAKLLAKTSAAMSMGYITVMSSLTAFAASESSEAVNLNDVTAPIIGLLETVFNVLIPLVAAVGAIFCISLGIKYAKAEEPQEREKAKQHLKSAIIGFVLVFVLVVVLRIGTPLMQNWMNSVS